MSMRHIVAATDLSEPAQEALRQAHELASAEGAKLTVCHIVAQEILVHPLFPQQSREDAFQVFGTREKAHEAVAARVERATGRTGESVEIVIDQGPAAAGIVRIAEDREADRIFVGSHGATGIVRMLVGSVALSVARHAHCPVHVARHREGTGKIVVGTDFSDPAFPAVAAAATEARRTGGRVAIVHAVDVPGVSIAVPGAPLGGFMTQLADYQHAQEEDAQRRLSAALADAGIDGDRVVELGPAAPSIVRVAETLRADLIVVGTRGRTGLRRMLLGNVAEDVVRLAHCSVLVVRLHAK